MELTYIGNGIDAIVIDNLYTEEQASVIFSTCVSLSEAFVTPEKTAGAISNGKIIKSNNGIFVDAIPFQEILKSKQFNDSLIIQCSFYKVFRELKQIRTLVSLYKDGDYYGKHIDDSIFTMVLYVNETPKPYTGGDIILYSCYDGYTTKIETKNNRAIIFPSCTPHEVTPVVGSGRFCISHFIS